MKLQQIITQITENPPAAPEQQQALLEQLREAAKREDVNALVPFSYPKPMSYIATGDKRASALHILAFGKSPELSVRAMNLLIDAGAKPEIEDTNIGNTPVLLAIATGNQPLALALIQRMGQGNEATKRGLNTADKGRNCNNTPLVLALKKGDTEIALALLNAGADPDMPARDNQSPLHWAAFFRNNTVLKKLLEKKACPMVQNDYGFWPGDYYHNRLACREFGAENKYGMEMDELHFHRPFDMQQRDAIAHEIDLPHVLRDRPSMYNVVDPYLICIKENQGYLTRKSPSMSAEFFEKHFRNALTNIGILEEWYQENGLAWDKKGFMEQLWPNLALTRAQNHNINVDQNLLRKLQPEATPVAATSHAERAGRVSIDEALSNDTINFLIAAEVINEAMLRTLEPKLLRGLMEMDTGVREMLMDGSINFDQWKEMNPESRQR